jgi:tetratricopeptide (TPR) repeat protein
VALADLSGDKFQRLTKRTRLATTLHQLGRTAEAAATFQQAEEMQQNDSTRSFLHSVQGFWYCELLLDLGHIQEVKDRATQALEVAKRNNWLLDIALDNLSMGRALLLEAQQGVAGEIAKAAEFLHHAVDGLRKAGQMDELPRGLLARASLHRVNDDYRESEHDLGDALRIATRGGMDLHLADCHLESARLHLAQGNQFKAREHWTAAKTMIDRMSYHRRDNEVNEIARQLL